MKRTHSDTSLTNIASNSVIDDSTTELGFEEGINYWETQEFIPFLAHLSSI